MIIDECKAFFGKYADYVLDAGVSSIELKIKASDLKSRLEMVSCYIFFEGSERNPVYEEFDPNGNQSKPRDIIGYEDISYKNRFVISVYDNTRGSTAGFVIQPTKNAVDEEITENNTISVVLDRYINMKAIETRILPEIIYKQVSNDVKQSIQSSLIGTEVDAFLTNVLEKTNSTLTQHECEIKNVIGPRDLKRLFLQYINAAIETRLDYVLTRIRGKGLLKSQFETPLKQLNSSSLQQVDDALSRILGV